MTDIETLLRDTLSERAAMIDAGSDLVAASRARGRRHLRRRRTVVGGAAVLATTATGAAVVGAGLVTGEGHPSGRLSVQALDSQTSTPAAASTPVHISVLQDCPDGQVAQVSQTSDQPTATGQLDSATAGNGGPATPVAASEIVQDYLASLSSTQGEVAWVRAGGAVVGDSTSLLPLVAVGDDANNDSPSSLVVLELTDDDSAWAAYPVSFDECLPNPR